MRFRSIFCAFTVMFTLASCGSVDSTIEKEPAAKPISSQIVGGVVSRRGSRPYMAHLGGCGGSIIGRQWILTAAHCISRRGPSTVRVGMYNRNNRSEGETIRVQRYFRHPNYRGVSGGYDIALLKLSRPITHRDAAPIALPGNNVERALNVDGKFAVVSGWGRMRGGGSVSSQLLEVSLPIAPDPPRCGRSRVPRNVVCGKRYHGKDSCNGDSGGPLASKYRNGKWYVLGIVSYGPRGCRGDGVYTRVNGYLDWIERVSGIRADNGR